MLKINYNNNDTNPPAKMSRCMNFKNITVFDSLPTELLNDIYMYFPYTITRLLCRKTNEMIKAESITPTGCAHSIHIAIQRFHWRWTSNPPLRCTTLRSVALTRNGQKSSFYEEDVIYWRNKRETKFIEDTLAFHKKWTGPPVRYDSYCCGHHRHPIGIHIGSN
jgi:hypothetical protein